MKRGAIYLFWALAGCVAQEPLALPDKGEHRALIAVTIDETGAVSAFARSLEEPLDLPLVLSGDTEIYLLYFRTGIAELGIVPGALTLDSGLGCGRPLPRADETWGSRSDTRVFTPASLPERVANLRVPSDFSSCPQLGGLEIDLRCGNSHCFGALRQEGCKVVLDLSACARGEITLPIDRSGAICIEANEHLGACSTIPSRASDIVQTLSCAPGALGTCELEIYQTSAAVDRIEVETVQLEDVEPIIGVFERPPIGYLSELVVLEDRVVVSALGGTETAFCRSPLPGTAYFLDRETMQVTGTASTPPCLTNLAPDPTGDGFVGTFRVGLRPALGRFDRHARLLGSVVSTQVDAGELFANSIAVDLANGNIAGAVIKTADERGNSYLFAIDLDTMSELPISGRIGTNVVELQNFAPGEFSALEDADNFIMSIDTSNGTIERLATTALVRGSNGMLLRHRVDDREYFLLSIIGPAGGVISYNINGEIAGRARPHRALSDTWSIADWPAPNEPRLVLAGFTSDDSEHRGYVGLVDVVEARFLLGEVRVGRGPAVVGRFKKDELDRLWATLPWSAEVIRVRPR